VEDASEGVRRQWEGKSLEQALYAKHGLSTMSGASCNRALMIVTAQLCMRLEPICAEAHDHGPARASVQYSNVRLL